jgi:hypothetical protein
MFLETYVASWIFAGLGIAHERPRWLLISALLATPLCWYLANTPRFRGNTPYFFAGCYLLAALAVRWHYRWLATLLLLPPIGFFYVFLYSTFGLAV